MLLNKNKINSIIISLFLFYLFLTPPNLVLPFFFGKYEKLHYVVLITLILIYLIINNFQSIRSQFFLLTLSILLYITTTVTDELSTYGQIVKLLFSLIIVLNVDYKSLELGLKKSTQIIGK